MRLATWHFPIPRNSRGAAACLEGQRDGLFQVRTRILFGAKFFCLLISRVSGWRLGRWARIERRGKARGSDWRAREDHSCRRGGCGGSELFLCDNRERGTRCLRRRGRELAAENAGIGHKAGAFGAIAAAGGNRRLAYALASGGSSWAKAPGATWWRSNPKTPGGNWKIVFRESTHGAATIWRARGSSNAKGIDWGIDQSIIFDAPCGFRRSDKKVWPYFLRHRDTTQEHWMVERIGRRWEPEHTRRIGAFGTITRGLDVSTSYGVEFDPFDAKHIFIDYTDIGAFQSYDGIISWETATPEFRIGGATRL